MSVFGGFPIAKFRNFSIKSRQILIMIGIPSVGNKKYRRIFKLFLKKNSYTLSDFVFQISDVPSLATIPSQEKFHH
jgi:hypothetical protein